MSNSMYGNCESCAPWHKASFDKFISESLPGILAQRLPLTGYSVDSESEYHCRIVVTIADIEVEYNVLQPDKAGIFEVDGKPYVVVPMATSEDLENADVRCVGEQLFDYVESKLGEAAGGLPWDEQLIRAWVPLDNWVYEVVTSVTADPVGRWASGQPVDTSNGVAFRTHLRRIVIPDISDVIHPSQFSRVCPFEFPEGPNLGHVFSIALGATIQNRKIVITDNTPVASLGLMASMVPFLEHNDPTRQTFGVNMIRQWMIPDETEPALIQTGNEPDAPGVQCGRNLLTAYICYGAETYEDSIVVSETCARKLGTGGPAKIGDKLSNRHGSKGVIGKILPDDQMPHMSDGTPVELVFSFIGFHTRLNLGQLREAVMGRIAKSEGETLLIKPFAAPGEDEIKARLITAGLPVDGMDKLTIGRNGKEMEYRSTVGWVYWGRTYHISDYKIHSGVTGNYLNLQGEFEYYILRDIECFNTIRSMYNTCSADRSDIDEFVKAVSTGTIKQSGYPSPAFIRLQKHLRLAGIDCKMDDTNGLAFALKEPEGDTISLASPVLHPWLKGHTINSISLDPPIPHPWLKRHTVNSRECLDQTSKLQALEESNNKLKKAMLSNAPESLLEKAKNDLRNCVDRYFSSLIIPETLRFNNRVLFSGRTVAAPDGNLRLDQIGLANEIAWTVFGPLVVREMGDDKSVTERTEEAAEALDRIMADSWVVVNRAPTCIPTAILAFHPARIPHNVLTINPLICYLTNGDFDGDQMAMFLPISEEGQREAGEKLSVAGHLRRDPNLYGCTFIRHEALWGLAKLSTTPGGMEEIEHITGMSFPAAGLVDMEMVSSAIKRVIKERGIDPALEVITALYKKGIEIASESGASISPFCGSNLRLPELPADNSETSWQEYEYEVIDTLEGITDYTNSDIGPQILAIKSRARGGVRQLMRAVSPVAPIRNASGQEVVIRHSLLDGLSPEEIYAFIAQSRRGLARMSDDMVREAYGVRRSKTTNGFGVMARAMRAAQVENMMFVPEVTITRGIKSSQPGKIIAKAAAAGERDPLTDLDTRLFMGLV